MARTSASKRLQQLVERFTPIIQQAFVDAIRDISNRAVIANLVDAIEQGDINRAIRSLGLDASAFRALSAEVERAFETGGVFTASTFPNSVNTPLGPTVIRFDVRNSRAEAWLRDHSSTLVTAIFEDTRAVVRTTIQAGMVEGINPRSIALDLVGRIDTNPASATYKMRVGGVIGLTPGQERWVVNTRRDLASINVLIRERANMLAAGDTKGAARILNKIEDSQYFNRALRGVGSDKVILASARDGQPLSGATIDKLTTQYKNNALRYRGEVIGRTEAIASLNKAEHEAINQAVDAGAIRPDDVKRVWNSAGNDGRTRETHLNTYPEGMDGQTVGLNEPFVFPGGGEAMFPGDTSLGAPPEETIQCRCVATTVVDWLGGARGAVTPQEAAAIRAMSDADLFNGR